MYFWTWLIKLITRLFWWFFSLKNAVPNKPFITYFQKDTDRCVLLVLTVEFITRLICVPFHEMQYLTNQLKQTFSKTPTEVYFWLLRVDRSLFITRHPQTFGLCGVNRIHYKGNIKCSPCQSNLNRLAL